MPGYVWQWFTDLEKLAVEYTYYVPLDVHLKEADTDNRKVWSPALASMMVNAGGIIDSFFRAAISNPTFDKVNLSKTTPKLSIEQLRSNPDKANIEASGSDLHFRHSVLSGGLREFRGRIP